MNYNLSNFSGDEVAPCKLKVIAARNPNDAVNNTGTAKVVYTKTLANCSAANDSLSVTIKAKNGKSTSNTTYHLALGLYDADGELDASDSATFKSKIRNLITNLKSSYSRSRP